MRGQPWGSVTDADLRSLDLTAFLGGENPYGKHDRSVHNAYAHGKDFYEEMVTERVGFVDGRVLDLLSGFGRWIPFLSACNREVVALERLPGCVELSRRLCEHFQLSNVSFIKGDIKKMKRLESASFDYVWIWSGLQYVERALALREVRRVLKPGGRVFVGAYNATGLMLEHVMDGAENGTAFDGASRWALDALWRGRASDGNPNFMDLDGCAGLCERFGLSLIGAAPQNYLDIRHPACRRDGWESAGHIGAYFRTIEFLAEKATGGRVRTHERWAPALARRMKRTVDRYLER